MKTYQFFQHGKWHDAKDHIDAINPATLQPFAKTPAMSKEQVDAAINDCHAAFAEWSLPSNYKKRIAFINKVADLMEADAPALADTVMTEVAKRKSDALKEVLRTVEYIRSTNEEYAKLMQNPLHYSEQQLKGLDATFIRVPLGVVMCISPYNYPVNLAISKIAPALVAGNTVAFKPATQGVVSGIHLATYFDKAGLPPGVFNMVVGRGRDIGDFSVTHPHVAMINFTGSTSVGNNIAKIAPRRPLILELGGKDFAIVRDDADLVRSASEIIKGAFSYAGQRCTAIKRVLVTKKNKEALEKLLVQEVEKLSVGSPESDAFVTPVIDQKGADYVMGLIDDAVQHGAKVLVGGKNQKNLIWPTVVTNVTADMKLAWEEPFGPVLPIIEVTGDEQAIALSNQSEYGLQGSIFTKDTERGYAMAMLLDTGSININQSSSRGPDIMPFIGVKNSGFGVQGIIDSLLSMTRYKGVVIKR